MAFFFFIWYIYIGILVFDNPEVEVANSLILYQFNLDRLSSVEIPQW